MDKQQECDIKQPSVEFNHLLKTVREQAGISVSAMARLMKVHRNTQVNYETDRDPSIDYMAAFCYAAKFSFWLLIAHRIKYGSSRSEVIEYALEQVGPIYQEIKEISANYDIVPEKKINHKTQPQAEPVLFACQNLMEAHIRQPGVKVYRQQGNSMQPRINQDDQLFVDTNDKDIRDGEVYFIKNGQDYVARRLQNAPDGGVLITSDNSQFAPIKIDIENVKQLTIIGRLVTCISCF